MRLNKDVILMTLFCILVTSYCFYLIHDNPLIIDEKYHYTQIEKFLDNDYTLLSVLTTIPGYHFIMMFITIILKNSSVALIRFLNLLIGLYSVYIFYLIAKELNETYAFTKTLSYYFFPILFPLFYLIYTDVMSIAFVLLALYYALRKQYFFSGIIGCASILIRQNNIIWLGFLVILTYVIENKSINTLTIFNHLKKTWIFIIGFIGFTVFVILNNGVAIGDSLMHPLFLGLDNVYFILITFFFLFLPLNIYNFPKVLAFIKSNKLKNLIFFTLLLTLYLITFKVNHPYNQVHFFLRNLFLIFFTSNILLKVLIFLPLYYSIISLKVTRLKHGSYYLLYPFTFLYLIPSWMIEQRYYLISFILFILFKDEESLHLEKKTILFYIILSMLLFLGIWMGFFFL